MAEEDAISPKEKDVISQIKDKLFSSEKVTKGELILIISTWILIIVILYTYFASQCTLDCSMCENTRQTLFQSGIGDIKLK